MIVVDTAHICAPATTIKKRPRPGTAKSPVLACPGDHTPGSRKAKHPIKGRGTHERRTARKHAGGSQTHSDGLPDASGKGLYDTGRVNGHPVVLGSCGAWPEPGRACSGLVVEHDGAQIVIDLGYGTLPRLLSLPGSSSADGVDAVIVTHAHSGHMVDLHGLLRAGRCRGRVRRQILLADEGLEVPPGPMGPAG